MKLLFDQNLSYRLVDMLVDIFPHSSQVRLLGLDRSSDEEIWNHSIVNEYVIVTQDADFETRTRVHGHPPKVIWLTFGNASTEQMAILIRSHLQDILAFEMDDQAGCLQIY